MPFMVITAHYYLDDLYEELGPTKFIAGSHLSGRGPKPDEETWNGKPAQAVKYARNLLLCVISGHVPDRLLVSAAAGEGRRLRALCLDRLAPRLSQHL